MIIGFCFICLFAVLINKVCLQVTVMGFIGGSVVLPCSSTEHDLKLQNIDVFWRDKDNEIIYNLIKGTDSLEKQDPRYKNRALTFPDEYKRGNFSIKLINLTRADAGTFICFITHLDEQETVELIINEQEENDGQETQLYGWQISLICVFTLLLTLLFLSIACFKFKQRKRNQASI